MFFRQVSWFRRQNSSLSVLTIGGDTFSADDRYSLQLDKLTNNWRLRIKPTMAVDDGTYLCQISTHPPTILLTNLKIIGKFNGATTKVLTRKVQLLENPFIVFRFFGVLGRWQLAR